MKNDIRFIKELAGIDDPITLEETYNPLPDEEEPIFGLDPEDPDYDKMQRQLKVLKAHDIVSYNRIKHLD